MIFQEPMTSFSPLHTIGNQIGEALAIHRPVSDEESAKRRSNAAAGGISPPAEAINSYPVRASGGLGSERWWPWR
jgi:peptide/nickel transport system ATP-binding protein